MNMPLNTSANISDPVAQARYNMIEQQIRPWNVLDADVLDHCPADPQRTAAHHHSPAPDPLYGRQQGLSGRRLCVPGKVLPVQVPLLDRDPLALNRVRFGGGGRLHRRWRCH